MAKVSDPVQHKCKSCLLVSTVWDWQPESFNSAAKDLKQVGDFKAQVDWGLLCPNCRPEVPREGVDLRPADCREDQDDQAGSTLRVLVSHPRLDEPEVLWILASDLEDLVSVLNRRRDEIYLDPSRKLKKKDSREVEPGLRNWYQRVRAIIDQEVFVGDSIDVAPRILEFGRKSKGQQILRILTLINPGPKDVVFRLQGCVEASAAEGGQGVFPYSYGFDESHLKQPWYLDVGEFKVKPGTLAIPIVACFRRGQEKTTQSIDVWVGKKSPGEFLFSIQIRH